MIRFFTLLSIAGSLLAAANSPELLNAIRNGDYGQVSKLLRDGADVNTADSEGTTALMHSIIEADAKITKLLIARGANVNAKNALDSTALMYAATNLAKTRLLLDAGADVKAITRRGVTPMTVAVTAFGSTPILKLLVAKGAQPEDRLMTPVAQKGDLEAIQYLLSVGVRAGDATTLSAAVTGRCEACVRLLVEKGASAKNVRTDGVGVLNETAKRAMPELSQFLLDHGASLDSKDKEGYTLLMQAVLSMETPLDRDRMVQWLLSKGVDPNATNDRGDTAYQLAARVGIASTLDLLVNAGAKLTIESRRGRISLYARADDGTPRGAVFVPFCYYEAAANMLTNPVLDPFGKIPEFKYCAVKLTKGGTTPERMSFGGGILLPERLPEPVR